MGLRLITWNLNGLDPADLDVRSEAACLRLLLRPDPPHVVLLQEVVRRSWHAHLKHHFHAAGFAPWPADPTDTQSEYFTVLLIARSLRIVRGGVSPFPGSQMGRCLAWAQVAWGEGRLWLGSAHLESGTAASTERTQQLSEVVARLLDPDGGDAAIFGGDTNLRRSEEGAVARLGEVEDAWRAYGAPTADRVTWPSDGYPGAPRWGRNQGARFDRVLSRGLEVRAFSLIGRSAPGLRGPPSDHLGIEVEVDLRSQTSA